MVLFTSRRLSDKLSAKSAFAEALRNARNLSSKFNPIQDISGLSHYTKAFHACQWERNILHTKFIPSRYEFILHKNLFLHVRKWTISRKTT